MKVIPAIDLKDGQCVQLVGGDITRERVRVPDAVEQALAFSRSGASMLHVVDIDRALGRGSNQQIVRSIIEAVDVPLQVGGGIRDFEAIDDLLNAGASKVVLGTRAVKDPTFLVDAAGRYGNRLVVAVDARGTDIVINGWTAKGGRSLLEFAREIDRMNLAGFLYTDVEREGRMEGPNVRQVRELCENVKTPVIASGGIRSVDDLRQLKDAGAWGCVVGMALYTGAFNVREAEKAVA